VGLKRAKNARMESSEAMQQSHHCGIET